MEAWILTNSHTDVLCISGAGKLQVSSGPEAVRKHSGDLCPAKIWVYEAYFQSRADLSPEDWESRKDSYSACLPLLERCIHLYQLHPITFRVKVTAVVLHVNKKQAGTLSLILQVTSVLENKKHDAVLNVTARHITQN